MKIRVRKMFKDQEVMKCTLKKWDRNIVNTCVIKNEKVEGEVL